MACDFANGYQSEWLRVYLFSELRRKMTLGGRERPPRYQLLTIDRYGNAIVGSINSFVTMSAAVRPACIFAPIFS